jgi:glucokinase
VILAGDIGGTKINLALFERLGPGRVGPPIGPESHKSAGFGSFEELIEAYRGRHAGTLDAISFGVAGVVIRGHAKGTHIPWEIDASFASRRLGGAPVRLLNDLVAAGYAAARVLLNDTLLDEGGVAALGGPPVLVALPELPAPPAPPPERGPDGETRRAGPP